MIMYTLYRIGHALAIAMPLSLSYVVASFIADIVYLLAWRDRNAVITNLQIVMATTRDDPRVRMLARQVFRNFAKYLVDFFRFTKIDRAFIDRFVAIKGLEHVRDAMARGKGVVILSAHIGNWELGGLVVSLLGFPLSAVALTHRNDRVNDFFRGQRQVGNVRSIEIGASLRSAYAVLKRNGLLALLGDRDFTRHGVPVPFFGRTALIPKGPAAFAARVGSPIVPIFMVRNDDDSFTLQVEAPIVPPEGVTERRAFENLTKQCVAVMESCIRRYPSQWFVFRKIWEEYEKRDMRPHTIL